MPLSPDPAEASLLGRQVYFVRPHSVIQNTLLGDLIRNEYAVAILTDHTRIRDLVRSHPHCIAFLNIDEGYTEPEWEAIVREIQGDPATSDVRLGILTYHPDAELSHKYLLDLAVPCGYIKLSIGLEESTQTLLKVLEANEAKGRRQFMRVPVRQGWASLNLVEGNKLLTGHVFDISSVGMSCTFDDDATFVARSLLKDMQLKLKGMLCTVTAVVMGTRTVESGQTLYVLLFDPKTPDEVREKIRTFEKKVLQLNFDAEMGLPGTTTE